MNWQGVTTIGLACAALAGCAEPAPKATTVDPAAAFAMLGSGTPLLRCREACLDDWRKAEPKAEALAATGQWGGLARLVIATGYQDDLTVYYLGRAAEGLGFKPAAIRYYRESTTLSRTSIGCRYLSKLCGGTNLPQAAQARVAALEQPVRRPQIRPTAPPPAAGSPVPVPAPEPAASPEAPAAAVEVPTSPPPDVAPAAPAPPPPPPPLPSTSRPASGDFIEPPPAGR